MEVRFSWSKLDFTHFLKLSYRKNPHRVFIQSAIRIAHANNMLLRKRYHPFFLLKFVLSLGYHALGQCLPNAVSPTLPHIQNMREILPLGFNRKRWESFAM